MEKKYEGSWGDWKKRGNLSSTIGIIISLAISFIAPAPLNIIFFVFTCIYVALFFTTIGRPRKFPDNSFYVSTSDNNIFIKKGFAIQNQGYNDLPVNAISFYGSSAIAYVSSTKDNIASITLPNAADDTRLADFATVYKPVRGIFSQMKGVKYTFNAFQDYISQNYENGIGPFSMSFVSGAKDNVKIVFIRLDLYSNSEKRQTIENAVIFVSLKEPKKFLEENKM